MTGESRSMEQNVLERSGLMKDFLSEKINGLKRERLKEIREKFESNVGNVRKQFESVLGGDHVRGRAGDYCDILPARKLHHRNP